MDRPAAFEIRPEAVGARVVLSGDWTAMRLGRTGARLASALTDRNVAGFDLEALGRFDTAGAAALLDAGAIPRSVESTGRSDVIALLALVSASEQGPTGIGQAMVAGPYGLLISLGRGVSEAIGEAYSTLVFYGRLLSTLARLASRPWRVRWAPVVSLMERAGLDALPICAVTTFFVGATVAFLGVDLLAQFGAQIFSVELVGIGMLREFGVLVTAIILAGRSASSFAAEIGAMRMNQEIDAMQVMGVDPFEALVIPRFLAMLAMTPLLSFASMIAGLFGGALVIWLAAGLSPAFFLQRLLDNVGVSQFYLGMVKTPVIAMIIAAIGCRQGLEVGGDVEQLGRRVTTAVVQALFAIILADSAFAFLFVQVGL